MYNARLVELPDYGRLVVVTDLHGNFKDYKRYIRLWDENDSDFHIVFTGDLIHAMDDEDGSVEILEDVIYKTRKYSNFHCLLGNHEWCHITSKDIFKSGKNLRASFESLVCRKKGYMEPSFTDYVYFFKSMPFFAKTFNGIFISHAGPSAKICSLNDFKAMCEDNHFSLSLHDFLWNRYGKYTVGDIDNFLNIMDSKFMVVGHTVVDGGYRIIGNQMILSSSFFTTAKSYLDIDLSCKLDDIDDLTGCVKTMD